MFNDDLTVDVIAVMIAAAQREVDVLQAAYEVLDAASNKPYPYGQDAKAAQEWRDAHATRHDAHCRREGAWAVLDAVLEAACGEPPQSLQ